MKWAFLSILLLFAWQAGAATIVANAVGAEVQRDFAPIVAALHH